MAQTEEHVRERSARSCLFGLLFFLARRRHGRLAARCALLLLLDHLLDYLLLGRFGGLGRLGGGWCGVRFHGGFYDCGGGRLGFDADLRERDGRLFGGGERGRRGRGDGGRAQLGGDDGVRQRSRVFRLAVGRERGVGRERRPQLQLARRLAPLLRYRTKSFPPLFSRFG